MWFQGHDYAYYNTRDFECIYLAKEKKQDVIRFQMLSGWHVDHLKRFKTQKETKDFLDKFMEEVNKG